MSSESDSLNDDRNFNRNAWDEIAKQGNRFYQTLSAAEIERARSGDLQIQLTPVKRIPRPWLGDVRSKRVLCLACGGGQQAPLFAAAGAEVTVFDISSQQLLRDDQVAAEFGLSVATMQGDMADMSCLDSDSFDLVVNPCSVCFCPDVRPIWSEAFRVLKPGCCLLTGLVNPVDYLFDAIKSIDTGDLIVTHRIPYSDHDLSDSDKSRLVDPGRPIEYGHTLSQLIGGQLDAGFQLIGFYEDRWGGADKLSRFLDVFVATRAIKHTTVERSD